mgnify:CR=1 FL=1|tara:strand:+ start:122501 stop:122764 length:264 start_codon:yes stop_codon:yes gene_type:complete
MLVVLFPFFLKPKMPETKPEIPEPKDTSYENRLHPEDQARVDGFIKRGVNSVERKPFRPLRLLVILIVVVLGLSMFSQFLAHWAGVY